VRKVDQSDMPDRMKVKKRSHFCQESSINSLA